MKYIKASDYDALKIDWWLEIESTIPECICYFGPFSSKKEAEISQYKYVKNLIEAKHHGIRVKLECSPSFFPSAQWRFRGKQPPRLEVIP